MSEPNMTGTSWQSAILQSSSPDDGWKISRLWGGWLLANLDWAIKYQILTVTSNLYQHSQPSIMYKGQGQGQGLWDYVSDEMVKSR